MIYCMSDLHGHYENYIAMLREISFRPEDTLYVLGDVIDRGPDGIKILRDMMARPNVVPLLGNHELTAALCLKWLLQEITAERAEDLGEVELASLGDWMANGGEPTLRALQQLSRAEQREVLDYIRDMELYAEVEAGGSSFVLVHAGLDHFDPEKPLEDYELEDFLFCRPGPDQNYYPDCYVVYGHTPTRLLCRWTGEEPRDKIVRRGMQIAIDCGCGHGGPLGCLCLDTLEEFYTE